MASHEERNTVRLDVSNFGPIAEASVDLRPLTVFVGPSNTGKSYLATLTYALHRFFNGAPYRTEFTARFGLPEPRRDLPNPLLFMNRVGEEIDEDVQKEALASWYQHLVNQQPAMGNVLYLPENVASVVRRYLSPSHYWDEMIPEELARCFGTTATKWLIRHGSSSGGRVSLRNIASSDNAKLEPVRFDICFDESGFKSSGSVSRSTRLPIDNSYVDGLTRRFEVFKLFEGETFSRPESTHYSFWELAGTVGATLVSPLNRRAYYLPVDRTGVMHAHRVVVASMISSAPTAGLMTNAPLPRLSGVLSDFLLQLLSIGDEQLRDGKSPSCDLGENIEKKVLLGQIRADRSNPTYPVFSYLPQGWSSPLPLMNASSMVSELAPMVLYLRHVVKPGEVLIIEEPESNLHPAMQVEFMRQLAAVVNAGVRIMITTHSEWILDELANLVRLSELPPEKRTPRLKNEPALDPRDVGVWLFERGKEDDGSRVKELPFDVNEGGFATGYEDTARLTYNQWAAIHNLLQK